MDPMDLPVPAVRSAAECPLMAQADAGPDEDTKKLWQEAYAIEVERAERLQSPDQEAATLPPPPQSGSAAEWQAAYEALKARPNVEK